MGNTSHVYVVVVVYVWTVSKSLYIQCNEVKEEEDEKKTASESISDFAYISPSFYLLSFQWKWVILLLGQFTHPTTSNTNSKFRVHRNHCVSVWVSERFLHVKRNFFDQKTARKPLYSMAYIAIAWALRHY